MKEEKTSDRLEELRNQIDEIDHDIVNKLSERMRISKKIGEYKKEHGMPIHQENRFAEVLRRVTEEADKQKISADFICAIYEIIHKESKRTQLN